MNNAFLLHNKWISFLDNDFFWETHHPTYGPMLSVQRYAGWSRTQAGFARRAPELGEHSEEILEEFGLERERIAALIGAGIVGAGGEA